jgi:hypothetical protein
MYVYNMFNILPWCPCIIPLIYQQDDWEIKTQDWTLSKNNNPGWVFIKKYQEPCFHDFFLKLIIWNIDIHTCLLDSTFLCPHLYINNNFRRRSIFSIFIGISSVAEYHINCLCTELSSLLCDRHSHDNTSFSLFGPVELKISKLS